MINKTDKIFLKGTVQFEVNFFYLWVNFAFKVVLTTLTLFTFTPPTGNVWIYSIYQPSYTPGTDQYCNKTLYLFSFWTTTLVYIFLGIVFLGGCCMLFCMCLFGAVSGNADNDV